MGRPILAILLHTHLPLLRGTGTWPVGEEWLYQAMAESHLRVLITLEELARAGYRGVTVAISPVLAEQWADPAVLRSFLYWLGQAILRAERHTSEYRGEYEEQERALGAFYHRLYSSLAEEAAALVREGGLVAGFASLARDGAVELWSEPLTHPFLPLLTTTPFRRAQVLGGVVHHLLAFGARPRGIWLPECGYTPGVEELLAEAGVEVTCLAGEGRAGQVGGVKALVESRELRELVWSPRGYPSSPAYRDFWMADSYTGLKTRAIGSGYHPPYDPGKALAKVEEDARSFARAVRERAEAWRGPLTLALDTELLGHWWFEGPYFLRHLLPALEEEDVLLLHASEAAECGRGALRAAPSWAEEGLAPWLEGEAGAFWEEVGDLEKGLLQALQSSQGAPAEDLEEACRQIMLAQASDWAFMVTRGRAAEFGRARFRTHARLARDLLSTDPARRSPAREEAARTSRGFPRHPLSHLQAPLERRGVQG